MIHNAQAWVMNCWMKSHQAVCLLQTDPERRPFYYRDFRRLITRRFPYKIFYRIEGERVIIFRILHAKRKHQWQLKE